MDFDSFDKSMRAYEQSLDQFPPPDSYLVARLDGRSFTRLTKEICSFDAPFDTGFRDMMLSTVRALMDCGFRVIYGFTQSDEISLLFHPAEDAFGRMVRKYDSTLAGVASAAFSLQLGQPAVFDCRMVPLPSAELVQDYFLWRQEDACRNALNAHCYWLLRKEGVSAQAAAKLLDGRSTAHKKELLLGRGVDFHTLPLWQKRGVGIWWKGVEKEGYDPVRNVKVTTMRRSLHTGYDLPVREEYAALVAGILER